MHETEKQRHAERAVQLIAEQNFTAALIAGAVAMLLAAGAYGAVVATWPMYHGFAAAGVGIFVGSAIVFLGRGLETKFALLAVAYTVAGCLLGNVFVRAIVLAQAVRAPVTDSFRGQSWSTLAEWAVDGLGLGHVLYWLVAVVAAGFLARRPLSRADRLAVGLYRLRG